MLGAYSRTRPTFAGATLRPRTAARTEARLRADADDVLARLGLDEAAGGFALAVDRDASFARLVGALADGLGTQ